MENFFGLLKQEMYYGITYYSFDELKEALTSTFAGDKIKIEVFF